MANIYNKVAVKVQRKSGFDKSFQNLFTSKVGTITPILVDELIPNTSVNLRLAISTQLPPLASDTFMRVKQKYAAFFVPTRILMPGFEKWLTGKIDIAGTGTSNKIRTPQYEINLKDYKAGSLHDFLGIKINKAAIPNADKKITVNALPYLAYHKIYNDWFRNSLVQTDIFGPAAINFADLRASNSNLYIPNTSSTGFKFLESAVNINAVNSDMFADGVKLNALRQANFGVDLFTSSTPSPQNGQGQAVSVTMPENAGDDGTFTISALRAANSMQQFLERNNLAGNRLVDYVRAQYGANLNDAIAQRPVLLGSGSFDVYSKGIYQTAETNTDTATTETYNNPFRATPAAKYGSASVDGQDLVIKGFTAMEPGYLMVLTWLSPKVTYSTGIDPMLKRYSQSSSQSDMANPILQNVGNEPVYLDMLNSYDLVTATNQIFGYNDRYYAWKDKQDEVHGLLRDGESLQSFALQRTFSSQGGGISNSFLQIPTNYMDQVASVGNQISDYGYWCDTYFDYKVSMPLATYSVPSLQDPAYEHGQDVVIDRAGKQLT